MSSNTILTKTKVMILPVKNFRNSNKPTIYSLIPKNESYMMKLDPWVMISMKMPFSQPTSISDKFIRKLNRKISRVSQRSTDLDQCKSKICWNTMNHMKAT